jgi:hypothetical protein
MMRSRTMSVRLPGCVAFAALLLAQPRSAAAATNELNKAGAAVIAELRQAGAAAQQRARAIAAAPSLVYAVATDQQTMLDMTAAELSFHAAPGEVVEVGQISVATGAVTSLRREGSAALMHLPLGAAGLHFVAAADELYAVAVIEVKPRERADVVRGAVGVAERVNLTASSAQLAQLGGGAVLRTRDGSIELGQRPVSASSLELPVNLGSAADPQLTLLVPTVDKLATAMIVFGLIGVVVGVVMLQRRRRSGEQAPPYQPPSSARAH